MKFQSRFALVASALVAAIALATAAHAGDPLRCKREIAEELSSYVQAKTKALKKCHEGIVKGTLNTCPDVVASVKIARAETKMRLGISQRCGGSTKSCTDPDKVALDLIGWNIGACPNFENGTCTNAITNCDGISDCLVCVGEAAVDQAIGLYYDDLVPAEFGSGSAVNRCQIAIGRNAAQFIAVKNKALQKCEDRVLKSTIVGPCPDAVRAQPKIDKAQTKMQAEICRACGGADRLCGGGDDLDAATIGFASSCPDVTVPGGSPCLATVTTLQDIVNCVTCVTEYKDDCLDPIAVPAVKPTYPTECNPPPPPGPPCASTPNNTPTPCPTATPGIVCPSKVVTTDEDGAGVDLDSGWSGQSHDAHAPSGSLLTLAISGCAHPDGPGGSICGVCNTSGPLPNAGGTASNNERCVLDTSIQCTADGNCAGISRHCVNSNLCVGGSNDGNPCATISECPGSGANCAPRTCTSDLNCLNCQGGSNDGAVCTVDSQCPGGACGGTGTCETSPCSFFFGSPLPLSSGGVTVCVTNQITEPVSGTVDIENGTTATTIHLLSRIHVGGLSLGRPCPTCDTLRCHGGGNDGALCATASECPSGTCGLSCTGGPRDTLACVPNGADPLFGDVSFDCPPSPASDSGHLPITLPYASGSQTVTLTPTNPTCRASGYSGKKCFCDTCNNADATPCTSNNDCIAVGATVCGGKRCLSGPNEGLPCVNGTNCPTLCAGGTNNEMPCTVDSQCPGASCLGGTNNGAVCTVDSECPGGSNVHCIAASCPAACSVPGEKTRPNDCIDDVCSPTTTCVGGCNAFENCNGAFKCVGGTHNAQLCTVDSECPGGSCNEQCPGGTCVAGNEGKCANGPFETFCSIERFRGCASDGGCPKPGDHCGFGKFRDCFLDNGISGKCVGGTNNGSACTSGSECPGGTCGGTVTVTGVPYPTCGSSGTGSIGAFFCIPPTASDSVNAVSGLPGLGRILLPYSATFVP